MRHWEGIEHELDFTERVALIRCPVLLLVGEHDFICGPVWSRTVHEHVAGSTLHVIPDAGHMPQYEAPDTVRSLILEWLGEGYSAGA